VASLSIDWEFFVQQRELILEEGKSFTKLAFGPKDYLAAVIRTSVYFINPANGEGILCFLLDWSVCRRYY